MAIKVVIFNFIQLNCLITFCRIYNFFLHIATFKTNKMAEAHGEILDFMFANLDLDISLMRIRTHIETFKGEQLLLTLHTIT